jgi:hypothetical protein
MAGGMKRKYSTDERGHELPRKRALPRYEVAKAKDDAAGRESQRRATAYGRARGRS